MDLLDCAGQRLALGAANFHPFQAPKLHNECSSPSRCKCLIYIVIKMAAAAVLQTVCSCFCCHQEASQNAILDSAIQLLLHV